MRPVYTLGDIHGNFEMIFKWIAKYDIKDSIIIQVGDFGRGFQSNEEDRLKRLNDKLIKENIILYAIRGNHDDPFFFDSDGVTSELSNIFLLRDYVVLDLDGRKILCVGGAISIDRKVRTLNSSYWVDENFVLDVDKLETYKDIDYVITHSAPTFCPPVEFTDIVYSYCSIDPGLYQELPRERHDIKIMYDVLKKNNKILKWYYGHYHFSDIFKYEDTDFILLNINEFKEII